MLLEYKIEEQDFLDFQLFTASKSKRINKKKRNSWILLTIILLTFAFYFYLNQNYVLAVYFGIIAIACALFYPKYFKWRYKNHYKSYIRENYSKRFGETVIIDIKDGFIYSKDNTGEGKINLTSIERVDETDKHFFLKMNTGISLIIPKNNIQKPGELKIKFQESGLPVHDNKNWHWK